MPAWIFGDCCEDLLFRSSVANYFFFTGKGNMEKIRTNKKREKEE